MKEEKNLPSKWKIQEEKEKEKKAVFKTARAKARCQKE